VGEQVVSRARNLAHLPVTAAAWRDGVLSSGQVEAIAAHLDPDTLDLFADHERAIVPTLMGLPVPDVAAAMAAWRECATAHRDPKPEPSSALYLSPMLGGRWRLDANLDPETGELMATALRLAHSPDVDSEPARSPATRRAHALADICRHFLDHQQTRRAGRHRPHLNLILDLDRYQTLPAAGAASVNGTHLDHTTTDRPLCDTAIHRGLTHGPSAILDYGTATRTIPAPLYRRARGNRGNRAGRRHACRFLDLVHQAVEPKHAGDLFVGVVPVGIDHNALIRGRHLERLRFARPR
jgi:hypothetical protein